MNIYLWSMMMDKEEINYKSNGKTLFIIKRQQRIKL
jgi:hypothetical protein